MCIIVSGRIARRGGLSDPVAQGALRCRAIGRLVDAAGHVQAAFAIADPEVLGHVAQYVDPTDPAWHVGIDEVQSRMETAVAIGGDEPE